MTEAKTTGGGGAGSAAAVYDPTNEFDALRRLVDQLQVTGCTDSDLRALSQLIAEMKPLPVGQRARQ